MRSILGLITGQLPQSMGDGESFSIVYVAGLADAGWDGDCRSAQIEHEVLITENGAEILTLLE